LLIFLFVYINRVEKYNVYTDEEAGFIIKYPTTWLVSEKHSGTNVLFLAQKQNEADRFRENVSVVVQDLSSNPMGLNKYTDIAIDQMETVLGNEIEPLKSKLTYIDGHAGHRYVFRVPLPNFTLKYHIVWTVYGIKAYQITYTSLEQDYEKHLRIYKSMVKSFKIK